MKKLTCLLLTLVMLLSLASLAGCNTTEEADAQTQSPLPVSSSPNDHSADSDIPLDGAFIGTIAPTLESEWLTGMLNSFCEKMEAEGCTTQLISANNDNAQYVNLIENFMTMDASLILVVAQDAESVQDVCQRAMEQGIYVIMLGLYPENYEISGGIASDFYLTGWACADMACYWVNQTFPNAGEGEIHAALHLSDGFSDGVKRGQGFKDRLSEEYATEVTYAKSMGDGNIEKGFTLGEEAMLSDPEIRLFVTYDPDPGVGINNYIMQVPDYEPILEQFGIFVVGSSDAAVELCDASKEGKSVLRGILTYGGEDPGITLHQISVALLTGEHEPPYWIFDPCYTYTHLDYEFIEEEYKNTHS